MTEIQNAKPYDLEERTYNFARRVRELIRKIPRTMSSIEDGKQVIRSSGSVGANYIEANEALSKKDFLMRIKICRKESKETTYWLKLLEGTNNQELENERAWLIKESTELMKIFGAIIRKSE
jgi:four helix bundle protein